MGVIGGSPVKAILVVPTPVLNGGASDNDQRCAQALRDTIPDIRR